MAAKDLDALAELTAFPVYVGLPDVGAVETKEDFLALGADAVFTDELVASVADADTENMQPAWQDFLSQTEARQILTLALETEFWR